MTQAVCSWNEWDPLEEVIVGVIEGAWSFRGEVIARQMNGEQGPIDTTAFLYCH